MSFSNYRITFNVFTYKYVQKIITINGQNHDKLHIYNNTHVFLFQ